MALSKNYTAPEAWAEAVRDLGLEDAMVLDFERFKIINRAQNEIIDVIGPVVVNSYIKSASPTVTGDAADISALKIIRSLLDRVSLGSSSLSNVTCEPVTLDEYKAWRTTSQYNKSQIVYTITYDSILLKKGADVSSYGTLTFYYPALPVEVTQDSDSLDVPDGTAVELVILRMKKILAGRYAKPLENYDAMVGQKIRQLFDAAGISVSNEELVKKTQSLR